MLGLDYAVSRHFGLGALGAGDYVFVDSGLTVLAPARARGVPIRVVTLRGTSGSVQRWSSFGAAPP